MPYEKPRCDCGEELVLCADVVVTKFYKITKIGKESKRVYDTLPTEMINGTRLQCEECLAIYDYSFDKKERIIRNEQIST